MLGSCGDLYEGKLVVLFSPHDVSRISLAALPKSRPGEELTDAASFTEDSASLNTIMMKVAKHKSL